MEQNPQKLTISIEETQSERTENIVQQFKRAEEYVTVREVGDASLAKGNFTIITILIMAGAGVLGGFLAFLLFKVFDALFVTDTTASWIGNLAFTFILAFAIGSTIAIVDAATQRNISKTMQAAGIAIPASIAAGLGVGAVTHFLYSNWMESIYQNVSNQYASGAITEAEAWALITSQTHLPRGVAWALVGIGVGLTIGAASKSTKRMLLTISGGLVGGFFGGFLFDFMPGEAAAQILGMCLTGLLVGLSMALVEQARKARWIEIVSGGMAGKQFILYKNDITIGSAVQADITLIKDPGIPPIAARLLLAGGTSVLYSLDPNAPANVENRAGQQFTLSDGAQITIGTTIIRYRERAAGGQQNFETIQRYQ